MTRRWRQAPQVARERVRLLVHGAPRPEKRKRTPEEVLAHAYDEVAAIVSGDGPVIAGPWLGEVGYELLYWIPFLRWATREHPGLRERLVVISRGGVESWYGDVSSGYAEIFDLATFDELAAWRAEPQIAGEDEAASGVPALEPRKARRVTRGDTELIGRATERLEINGHALLHPSVFFRMMYRLRDLGAWEDVDRVSTFSRIEAPEANIDLPDRFVAVRFYTSTAFPDVPGNSALVGEIVRTLAERAPIVDLDTGLRRDDHEGLVVSRPYARLSDAGVAAARNLAVQTAVLDRAEAFVGTYGGLSYLAPLLGVPSLALYTNPRGFFHHHLAVADRLFAASGWGAFAALNIGSAPIRSLVVDALSR